MTKVGMLKSLIRLIRPSQWIKNLFVFAPVLFGGALLDTRALLAGLVAFLAFCFAASSIYCFNDIHDVADDRRHPEKCQRPIASGAISVAQAYGVMAVMIALGVAVTFLLPLIGLMAPTDGLAIDMPTVPEWGGVSATLFVVVFYWLLNLAYCVKLKQYAIIDVCIVAFGFVLRMLAGGGAAGIELSHWIVLMAFLITLFMGFAKRRDDVLQMEQTGEAPRKNTVRYNATFMDQALTITASVTLVCYIMYTVSPEVMDRFQTNKLYLTSIFVLVGLLRYIQVAVVDKRSGNPTKVVLRDRFIQLDVVAWIVTFILIIYVG
ncbi:UbiA prenyltransferase family protein [Hallella sp.]|uniref:UbiA prenyltransferase family protein n=1 Tax=Hallella sp. TaxID=2980186 RepID=UPI00307EF3FD